MTVYGTPRSSPAVRTYACFHVVPSKTHFCSPAVVCAAAAVYVSTRVEGVRAVAFVGDIKRRGVGKPNPERKRSWCFLRQRRRKAVKHAHIVGNDPLRLQERGVVINRRCGQASRWVRNTNSVRARQRLAIAIESRRIDEIDGVDAVAAAAFGRNRRRY